MQFAPLCLEVEEDREMKVKEKTKGKNRFWIFYRRRVFLGLSSFRFRYFLLANWKELAEQKKIKRNEERPNNGHDSVNAFSFFH